MLKEIRYSLILPLILLSLLMSLEVRAQDNEDVIRVDTNLVTIPVIVSDRQNRYIPGLKAENFAVFRDGQKQNIDYFIAEEAPVNVAILLDTSRSTEQAALLDKNPRPSDADIDAAITNLCRCGTLPRVRAAIHGAAVSLQPVAPPKPLKLKAERP